MTAMTATLDVVLTKIEQGYAAETVAGCVAPEERAAIQRELGLLLAHTVLAGEAPSRVRALARALAALYRAAADAEWARQAGAARVIGLLRLPPTAEDSR